jgi:AAA domain, putative AbiEii toxin, Type IV TA system/beta-keto acid cleavage enzyme
MQPRARRGSYKSKPILSCAAAEEQTILEQHPGLPRSPSQRATTCIDATKAGAAIIHSRARKSRAPMARVTSRNSRNGLRGQNAALADPTLKVPQPLPGPRQLRDHVGIARMRVQEVRHVESPPVIECIERSRQGMSLARPGVEEDALKVEARRLFKNLSSGHKIVLLTITRLVETVEEKTLVLLDEPEAHLHPPLLSAFVRALSDLLINRNGVAVIATHSPVVLQEVPQSCVWKIRRTGSRSVAERPDVQTFGENVGLLTREVFGLEVTQSGFHKMLRDAIAELPDYPAVVRKFNGELGDEARAIVQGLLAARDDQDEDDL